MATKKPAARKAAAKTPAKATNKKPAVKPVQKELKADETKPDNSIVSGPANASANNTGTDNSTNASGNTGNTDSASALIGNTPAAAQVQSEIASTSQAQVDQKALESNHEPIVIGLGHAGYYAGIAIAQHLPTIVIPYKKDSATGDELLFALRAWEKNLPGCSIVVIGDREDWFSDKVNFIEAPCQSENPQIDVAYKMLLAIASDLVPERFIWSNDDIYPVTMLHPADLELLTSEGLLENAIVREESVYSRNRQNTLELLRSVDASTFDYSTHTPYVFNKTDLAKMISSCGATEVGHLISSLYFNLVYPGVVPLKVDGGLNGSYFCKIHRKDPPVDAMRAAFEKRKFVNVNNHGYRAALSILQEKFADKSRFEI